MSNNALCSCRHAFAAGGKIARVSTELTSPADSAERFDTTRNITKPSVADDTVLMLDMLNTEFGAELTLRLRTQLR